MSKDPVKHCNLYKEDGCAHVDGILCDFDTCSMRVGYDNKYTALLKLVTEHNKSCDAECSANAKYCIDYLAVARRCGSCPKYYKVDIE
jgi:hypothetical protein